MLNSKVYLYNTYYRIYSHEAAPNQTHHCSHQSWVVLYGTPGSEGVPPQAWEGISYPQSLQIVETSSETHWDMFFSTFLFINGTLHKETSSHNLFNLFFSFVQIKFKITHLFWKRYHVLYRPVLNTLSNFLCATDVTTWDVSH